MNQGEKMKTNKEVIRAFAWGKRAAAGNLQTDGRSLWSYNLKIAQRTPEGIVVGNFTSPGGQFHSMTTSKHVGMAKREAHTVMLPELFSNLFSDMSF
jgi:Cu/Zn superoxide dismutase